MPCHNQPVATLETKDLSVLILTWGDLYDICWDFRVRKFRAHRRGTDTVLLADTTEDLHRLIRGDFATRPIQRP